MKEGQRQMFSGIIEELGTVKSLDKLRAVTKLQVFAPKIGPGTQVGQSICVNGICLTVVEARESLLSFEVMPETTRCSQLGLLKKADQVNLERALRIDARIDGHFVSGHIDGTGIIVKRQNKGSDCIIAVKSSEQILRHIALKGSVALDGVSLTVSALEEHSFAVSLIPYTLKNTTLGSKREASMVNIECDILAKYTDRFLTLNRPPQAQITPSFLQEHGFI